MSYREVRVAPGVVVWTAAGRAGEQRILPDGCLDLIAADDRLQVAGPDATARVHRSARAVPVAAVRLHGGRGPALLGVPAHELTGRTVDLADVWGERRARRLRDDLAAAPSTGLAAWATPAAPDPLGDRLVALLTRGHDVAAAASALGLSTRQLQRRAHDLFGYGPQHLARVLRLQRVLAGADAGHPWAQVAAEAGFSDQAHLARDVRALAGVTPGGLRAERVRSVQDDGDREALASRA